MKQTFLLTQVLTILLCSMLLAQVPQTLNYQGILTDVNGEAVSDGSYEIIFNLYDQASSGNDLWSEHQTVAVQDGVFSVILGIANPIDVAFDRPLWLAIRVNGGTELSPRIELTGSAYSFQALSVADGAVTNPKLSGGAVTENKLAEKAVTNSKLDSASVTAEKIASGAVVKSINGLKDDIELAAGDNVSINKNGSKLTISAVGGNGGGGDVTAVTAGEGLIGGGTSGDVTLAIADGAISNAKLADGAVNSAKIVDGSVEAKDMASGQVVKSLNGLRDNIELKAGENVSIATDENALVISATASGKVPTPLNLEGSTAGGFSIVTAKNNGDGHAFLGVHGESDNFGYLGSASNGAYGAFLGKTNGALGTESHGVLGKNFVSGTKGTLASNDYGASGDHGSGKRKGYLGSKDAGVQGIYTTSGSLHMVGTLGESFSGVSGFHEASNNLASLATSNYAVLAQAGSASKYAGYFTGKVHVAGNLSKATGSFKIDHPLDPANKYLSHSFVESPDMMNIYNGNVQLDANGEAWVQMPEWFEALNQEFRYQLTPIGASGPDLFIAEEISGNRFKIAGGVANSKVSWMVTGIRHDAYAEAHRIAVEEWKPENERGQYLHPVEHGAPASMAIGYEERQKMQTKMKALSTDIHHEKSEIN
jgi:hypothetical protein